MLSSKIWFYCCGFSLLSLNFWQLADSREDIKQKRILVLGGNGFMGSEVAVQLIDRGDDVTILNRGNLYYDSDIRVKPFVRHIKCDRDKALRLECHELLTSGHYDVVVDFSSYKLQQLQQVIDILKKRTDLYIYISTDSVYEVCNKTHNLPTREEDAVRPENSDLKKKYSKNETYGHEKLACEEALEHQFKHGGFPYVILRLPDVVGQRDNTLRWWTYQLWLRVHRAIEHPVHLPEGISQRYFSLVHSEDVSRAILMLIDAGGTESVRNQAINLAFEEKMTLEKMLTDIAEYLNISDPIYHIDDQTSWYTYPTVTKGPLDISKAKILLNWKPMTWLEAVKKTCDFYEETMKGKAFVDERGMVFADFLENIVQESYIENFLDRLMELYGEDVLLGMDLVDDDTPAIEGVTKVQETGTNQFNMKFDGTASDEVNVNTVKEEL